MQISPLAGLATYEEAARVGYSVEENVARFLRYAWIEKRAMEVGLYWLASTPEWEVKEALGLHLSLDADHAADIRVRVGEMRNPVPRMDVCPDPAIDRFFDELLTAQDTVEKIAGLYGVLKPALLAAYRTHYEKSNPVIDHPTRRMIKHILVDEAEIMEWGVGAVTAVTHPLSNPINPQCKLQSAVNLGQALWGKRRNPTANLRLGDGLYVVEINSAIGRHAVGRREFYF